MRSRRTLPPGHKEETFFHGFFLAQGSEIFFNAGKILMDIGMDIALLYALKAFLLGIVEGLTEFLPVSSTGHLILAGDLLHYDAPDAQTFFIAIQAGAILAVCWHYRERIASILKNLFSSPKEQHLAFNVIVAFLPAALIGAAFASAIKTHLFNSLTVAGALVVGGILILWIEGRQIKKGREPRVQTMDDMSWKDAFGVGLLQCLAMIPGTSRSGATIIGGLVLGLSRTAATEFSFFLSIPTIFGATVFDLWESRDVLAAASLTNLSVGFVMSFLSAVVVVRWLLRFVSHNDFRVFGWYRIVFGLVILAACAMGVMSV